MSDIEFPAGLFVNPPHPKAPAFVKAGISIKRKELGNWLRGRTEDWINLDVKVSGDGKWYAAVNTYKKDKPGKEPGKDDFVDSEISF